MHRHEFVQDVTFSNQRILYYKKSEKSTLIEIKIPDFRRHFSQNSTVVDVQLAQFQNNFNLFRFFVCICFTKPLAFPPLLLYHILMNNNNDIHDKLHLTEELKKRQARCVCALFIMLFVGAVTSIFSAFADEYTAAYPSKIRSLLDTVFDMISYTLYLGIPTFYMARANIEPIKIKKSVSRTFFFEVCFCLGSMYLGNLAVGYLQSFLDTVGISIAAPSPVSASGADEIALLYISSALLPALLEEILVRGYMLGAMGEYSPCCGIILSSLFFSLMHLSPLQNVFALSAGLSMGFFTQKNHSLNVAIAAHFINNSLALTKELISRGAAESVYIRFSLIADITVFVLGMISVFVIFRKKQELEEGEQVPFTLSPYTVLYALLALALAFTQITLG